MADWLDVKWGAHAAEAGRACGRLRLRVKNAPGSLAAVMSVIASNGGNIFNLATTARNPLFFEFLVDVEVRDAGAFAEHSGRATGERRGRIGRSRARAGG